MKKNPKGREAEIKRVKWHLKNSTLSSVIQGIESGKFVFWTDRGKENLIKELANKDIEIDKEKIINLLKKLETEEDSWPQEIAKAIAKEKPIKIRKR